MFNGVQLKHIWAMNESRCIGVDNQLPWSIPADLQRFKQRTLGGVIVMGRKTYESLGRNLPNRDHFVLSRQPGYAPDGVQVFNDLTTMLTTATEQAKLKGLENIWIIGGGQLYHATMLMTDGFEMTEVRDGGNGRTDGLMAYYPEFPQNYVIPCGKPTPWQIPADGSPAYRFVNLKANPNYQVNRS